MKAEHPSFPKGKKYATLKETSDHFQVPVTTLRYWETKISRLRPIKNGKGVRFYTTHDWSLIENILFYTKQRKFSLEETEQLMNDVIPTKEELIQELQEIAKFLRGLRDAL